MMIVISIIMITMMMMIIMKCQLCDPRGVKPTVASWHLLIPSCSAKHSFLIITIIIIIRMIMIMIIMLALILSECGIVLPDARGAACLSLALPCSGQTNIPIVVIIIIMMVIHHHYHHHFQ